MDAWRHANARIRVTLAIHFLRFCQGRDNAGTQAPESRKSTKEVLHRAIERIATRCQTELTKLCPEHPLQ
jgi:hypothetical protein